jgi:hypothetical protein
MLQGKPKALEPRRRRDLARVKRLSPEQCVRATSRPDAPPSLPASLPPVRALAPRPAAAEAAFQELSRNPPHVTAAPATALKRLGRQCAGFKEDGRRAAVAGACGVDARDSALPQPHSSRCRGPTGEKVLATANPDLAAAACHHRCQPNTPIRRIATGLGPCRGKGHSFYPPPAS